MLGLLAPTDPSWVDAVEADLASLLVDHAHCELKAAHTALALVGRFGGEMPALVAPLLALAEEETDHVRQVEARLRERGRTLGMPRTDDYVVELRRGARSDASSTPALLDRLVVSALVEARSCERFRLLSERLRDASLRSFYRELMGSEAQHYRLFVRLAEDAYGAAAARERVATLAAREAGVASRLPLGATVHG